MLFFGARLPRVHLWLPDYLSSRRLQVACCCVLFEFQSMQRDASVSVVR